MLQRRRNHASVPAPAGNERATSRNPRHPCAGSAVLHVRRDQILTLQAALDGPLVEYYVDLWRKDAQVVVGDDELELRERVRAGVATGRELEARSGWELDTTVLLAVFFRPDFHQLPEVVELLDQPFGLEAKLRLILAATLDAPEESA